MIENIHTLGLRTYIFQNASDAKRAIEIFKSFEKDQNRFESTLTQLNIEFSYADR